MHYPWVISSVPVRICSTRESYPQYPWGYAVPVSHILSTRESYPQYPWGYAVPVSHIISTCDSSPQYPLGYAVSVSKFIWMKNEWNLPHGYCISSQVLHTLTGTEDMTHGYWWWLTGTAYPHRYWGYDLRVLRIWLTGTAYPHGYWGYDSRVLMIWLTGNAHPRGYWISSRVMHIVYTGCTWFRNLSWKMIPWKTARPVKVYMEVPRVYISLSTELDPLIKFNWTIDLRLSANI